MAVRLVALKIPAPNATTRTDGRLMVTVSAGKITRAKVVLTTMAAEPIKF